MGTPAAHWLSVQPFFGLRGDALRGMNGRVSTPVEPASSDELFAAFRVGPRRRRYLWPTVVVTAALLAFVVTRKPDGTRVVTARGFATIKRGMSAHDVRGILGAPIDGERSGDADCLRYGHPTLEVPEFTIYSVCYASGRLRDVTEHHYSAEAVNPDGTPTELLHR